MSTVERFSHEFVNEVPERLHHGVVYVSIEYATAVHLCACGCGSEVVTPLTPLDWQVTYDGESVSFSPSVGNWSFPCQSHYWIVRNRVRWARRWTSGEIERQREYSRSRRSEAERKRRNDG